MWPLLLKIAILFVLCFTLLAWLSLPVLNRLLDGTRARRWFCDRLDWHQPFDVWAEPGTTQYHDIHIDACGRKPVIARTDEAVCSRCGRRLFADNGGVYRALYSDEGGYRD